MIELSLEKTTHQYVIRAYAPGIVMINKQEFAENIIVMPRQLIHPWQSKDYNVLLKIKAEIILIGTGQHRGKISPETLVQFYQQNIGLEVMDTGAACRTYNVLAAEGRKVAAALVMV